MILFSVNALSDYLTTLLEYIDLLAKDSVLNLIIVFWLISITALMYYCVNLTMVQLWLY